MNKRMLTRANGEKSDQQLSRAAGIAQVEIERSSDNKIRTVSESELSKIGIPVGLPARQLLAIHSLKTTKSVTIS